MTAKFRLFCSLVAGIQCASDAFTPAPSLSSLGRSTVLSHCHAKNRDRTFGLGAISMQKTTTISRERKAELLDLAKTWNVASPATTSADEAAQIIGQYSAPPTMACGKNSMMGSNTKHANQDDASFNLNVPELDGAAFMAVFDGHGHVGLNVAQRLARSVPRFLVQKVKEAGRLESAKLAEQCFKEAFAAAEQELFEKGNAEESSGATATVALVQGKDLAVGWVGDSRAVIGGHTQGGIGQMSDFPYGIKGGVHVERLTRDHVPSNKREQLRLLTCGGEIKRAAVSNGLESDYVYYRGKEFPGLSVTRSFGDKYGKMGNRHLISSEPEVVTRRLRESDEVMVMGSDGLWEHVTDAEAIQGALHFIEERDAARAAQHLSRLARERWLQHGKYCDDITVVVTFL